MRYLHRQVGAICQYLESIGISVMRCSYDGSSPPSVAAPGAIEDMLKQSHTLWGLRLPYFLSVAKSIETETLPLQEAVLRVEASRSDKFLIVAYQDDGIISISGTTLPFQEQAERAEWWRP